MKWPNDRTLTDAERKILDSWMGPLKLLEPLLNYTSADFVALQALIRASAADPFSLDAAIAALEVDTAPDLSADYLVSYDLSASATKRVAMSAFGPTLISTTSLSGSSSVDVSIPSGYRDIELRVRQMGFTGNCTPSVGFSEDGGASLVGHTARIYNDATNYSATPAGAGDFSLSSVTSSNFIWGRMFLLDYTSLAAKAVEETGVEQFQFAWSGGRVITSTLPINLVRYGTSANAFAAGTVELWGIP